MSSYIVKPESIGRLLTFLATDPKMGGIATKKDGITDRIFSFRSIEDIDAIGNLLYAENFRSFNYLYYKFDHDDAPKNRDFGWSFFPPVGSFSPDLITAYLVQILKTCDHYEYQSCECPDYFSTSAAQIIDAIRRAAICRLPGYNLAKWG